MPKKKISKDEIVVQTLELASELGWTNVTLMDVSDKSGLSLAELHDVFDLPSFLPSSLHLQKTPSLLRLAFNHRCFVCGFGLEEPGSGGLVLYTVLRYYSPSPLSLPRFTTIFRPM